jgi:ribosome-binding factor A
MATRRLEKVSRAIRSAVSEAIQSHLSDPRIQGIVSVTRVEPSADLRNARVYLSMVGVDEKQQELSLKGIQHAHGYIQSYLAGQLTMKVCPTLHFALDASFKKGIAITQILEELAAERAEREATESESTETQDEG